MKTLKLDFTNQINLIEKVNLIKQLYDFDESKEVIEVRLTGKISIGSYGIEKLRYDLITVEDKCYYNGNIFELVGNVILEIFIY